MEEVRGTEMELPVLLAAFGPMRRGEIAALSTDSISGTVVHVHRNMVLDENNQWVIKAPKSYYGDRYIDFPEFVAEKWQGLHGAVTDLVPSKITNRFVDVLIHAGLPHFRFHDLRHYSASIQHALGIPDSYIMQRGGWGERWCFEICIPPCDGGPGKRDERGSKQALHKFMQHELQHEK